MTEGHMVLAPAASLKPATMFGGDRMQSRQSHLNKGYAQRR
jgi:hypothetical protein